MKLINPSFEIMQLDTNILKHIELVARNCYKSEEKITEESAPKLVKMLYDRGHHAMLEFYPLYFYIHRDIIPKIVYLNQLSSIDGDFKWIDRGLDTVEASCNLRTAIMLNKHINLFGKAIVNRHPELEGWFDFIMGTGNEDLIQLVNRVQIPFDLQYTTIRFITNRGVTHELVRHRKCSFAQESTRYCNYGGKDVVFIIPSWYKDIITPGEVTNADTLGNEQLDWLDMCNVAEATYKDGMELYSWSPQQARGVLPNDLKTEIIVQARLSEWHHIFDQRCSNAAHPDMRQLMIPTREAMHTLYPTYF